MILETLVNFFLHIDVNLELAVITYGYLIYPLLFLIIFTETGIVIFPFLPGDSLIFAAGSIAAKGLMSLPLLFLIIASAAVIGNTTNYLLGRFAGQSLSRYVKKKNFERTQAFYEKYGGKTIIFTRFIPIIRTIAPFVAGVGKMDFPKFMLFNLIGGVLWTILFLFAGFYFGTIPFIKAHFSAVIIAIILISLLPVLIEYLRARKK